MPVYRVDIGPHRKRKRWKYIFADGKQTTDLCSTPNEARAAWKAGRRHELWENNKVSDGQ